MQCVCAIFDVRVCCLVRSDIGQEVGFEAVGIIDSKLPTTGVWARKADEVHVCRCSIYTVNWKSSYFC